MKAATLFAFKRFIKAQVRLNNSIVTHHPVKDRDLIIRLVSESHVSADKLTEEIENEMKDL